jgi:hypothetical protein
MITADGWYQPKDEHGDPVGERQWRACLLLPVAVKITIPQDQSTFAFCDNISFTAVVDGALVVQIDRMNYRTSDASVAESRTTPNWPATWHSPSAATYEVRARAVFSANTSYAESPSISVTVLRVSRRALDLILAQEITSRVYYEQRYLHPDWPGRKSGVTVGIGYDLGQTPANRIRSDWGPYVDSATLDRLAAASGVLGTEARDRRNTMRDITIPYEVAEQVYYKRTLPYWIAQTVRVYPEAEALHPNIAGALVSMIFNRGPSLTDAGRNPGASLEMRQIAEALRDGNVAALPQLFEDMERLWPSNSAEHRALRNRREAEAQMISRALQDPANACN